MLDIKLIKSMPNQILIAIALHVLVLLFGVSGCGSVVDRPLAPGRNLILVTIDTLRPDHLSFTGYARETSPFLDRFAANAVVFTQAIAQETETGPSLGSMFTSLYPNELGLIDNGNVLPSEAETLAERLQREGYHTISVTASPNAGVRTGLDQGFDEMIEIWRELPDGVSDPRAEYVTARTMRVLESVAGEDEKFFLYVHYIDPHTPYTPPEPFGSMFAVVPGKEKPYLLGDGQPFWGAAHYLTNHVGQISPNVRLADRSDVSYYVSQYDGEIRYVDEYLGRFLAALDEGSLGDQAVIVVTSDHGESLGEHDTYFAHGTNVYDTEARIPLLIQVPSPDVQPRRVDQQVSGVDLLPTILDLLGLQPQTSARGRSLVPMILGRTLPEELSFTETGPLDNHAYKHSIRFQGQKLILNEDGVDDYSLKPTGDRLQDEPWGVLNSQKRYELYDLLADPEESRNLFRVGPNRHAALLQTLLGLAEPGRIATGEKRTIEAPFDSKTEQLLRSLGYIR